MKLKYENLILGEKRKEMFLNGETFENINQTSAFYLNTTPVIYNLNVTDLKIASVLGRIPLLVIGRPGCGKSQASSDFLRYYFGGTQDGLALEIDGTKKDLNIYEECLTYLDKGKLSREVSDNISRCFYAMEEPNRQPEFTQNQFLNIATGKITSPQGEVLNLGKNNYTMVFATANIGNGKYKGTFGVDTALMNRFGIVINLDNPNYRPKQEDLEMLDFLSIQNPNVKEAPIRDISDKIIQASKEIEEKTLSPNIEERAIKNILRFGLSNCPKYQKKKNDEWYLKCPSCDMNTDSKTLCSLVREIDGRTPQNISRLAATMEYLIKLKDPNVNVKTSELIFKSFELCAAYQDLLNPQLLQNSDRFEKDNAQMIKEVSEGIKIIYESKKDQILSILEASEKGQDSNNVFYFNFKNPETKEETKGYQEGYDQLNSKTLERIKQDGGQIYPVKQKIDDKGVIGFSWINKSCKTFDNIRLRNKALEKRNLKKTKEKHQSPKK